VKLEKRLCTVGSGTKIKELGSSHQTRDNITIGGGHYCPVLVLGIRVQPHGWGGDKTDIKRHLHHDEGGGRGQGRKPIVRIRNNKRPKTTPKVAEGGGGGRRSS